MTERQIPPEHKEQRLHLIGMLQVTTARDALRRTGINPNTSNWLSAMIQLHEQKSEKNPKARFEIKVYGGVGQVTKMRTDIITSLAMVAKDKTLSEEERQPYSLLHEIMTTD